MIHVKRLARQKCKSFESIKNNKDINRKSKTAGDQLPIREELLLLHHYKNPQRSTSHKRSLTALVYAITSFYELEITEHK